MVHVVPAGQSHCAAQESAPRLESLAAASPDAVAASSTVTSGPASAEGTSPAVLLLGKDEEQPAKHGMSITNKALVRRRRCVEGKVRVAVEEFFVT
jgi:hypothetical protein